MGGLAVGLETGASGPALQVNGASSAFVAQTVEPDLELSVDWGTPAEGRASALLFDSGAVWRLFRERAGLLFTFRTPITPSRPYKSAWVDARFRRGQVLLDSGFFPRDEPVDPLEFPLDELLFTHLLAQGRGVEVHACGVVTAAGHGLLFAGQSGDGKSTTARLWAGRPGTTILSDDRVILRRQAGTTVIYGTPWHGEARFAARQDAPLAAVFVLEHGTGNELAPLARSEAAALLLARSFVPFYGRGALEHTLGLLNAVLAEVPCFRFPFVPDRSAVELALGWTGR